MFRCDIHPGRHVGPAHRSAVARGTRFRRDHLLDVPYPSEIGGARSSAGERLLHTQEVGGSKPPAPTKTRRSEHIRRLPAQALASTVAFLHPSCTRAPSIEEGGAAKTVAVSKRRTRIFSFAGDRDRLARTGGRIGVARGLWHRRVGLCVRPIRSGCAGDVGVPAVGGRLVNRDRRPPGAAIGFALSGVSNRAYFATGLGVALGSALYVTSRVIP